jgi:hypothetical protein
MIDRDLPMIITVEIEPRVRFDEYKDITTVTKISITNLGGTATTTVGGKHQTTSNTGAHIVGVCQREHREEKALEVEELTIWKTSNRSHCGPSAS